MDDVATSENGDMDLQVGEFRINGFTVFENAIPVDLVDELRAAFDPLLNAVRNRNSSELSGDLYMGRGRLGYPNRYSVEVPWAHPFSSPDIYEHPTLLAFMDQYWGASDYQFTGYTSNNPYPDSGYQRWHRDMPLTTPHIGLQTCDTVSAKIPLVDTFEENGSFEILPGTQYLADPSMQMRYQEIIEAGDFQSKRLNLKRGSIWMQDPRPIHRGTPNRSDHPRPELCLVYTRPWYGSGHHIEMTQNDFDGLSKRGQELLQVSRIIDGPQQTRREMEGERANQ